MKTNTIKTITKAPQFKGGKSAYLFVLCIFLLFLLIAFMVHENYIGIPIIVILLVLVIPYMLDIRGVQIDLTNNVIRHYKQSLWGQKGEWITLHTFDQIILTHEFYRVKTASPLETESHITKHGHFVVRLISKESKTSFSITEEIKYSGAKKIAHKLSKDIGFELDDTYHTKLTQSINMRSWQ